MEAVMQTALLEAKILTEYADAERDKWGAEDEADYEDLGDYDYRQYTAD